VGKLQSADHLFASQEFEGLLHSFLLYPVHIPIMDQVKIQQGSLLFNLHKTKEVLA
jgi:hypothetical protein